MKTLIACGWIQKATKPDPLQIDESLMKQMNQAMDWILTKTTAPAAATTEAPRKFYRGKADLDDQLVH